jgi:hypothetical protein
MAHAKALDLINKGISRFLFVYSSLVKSSFGVIYKPSAPIACSRGVDCGFRRPDAGRRDRGVQRLPAPSPGNEVQAASLFDQDLILARRRASVSG